MTASVHWLLLLLSYENDRHITLMCPSRYGNIEGRNSQSAFHWRKQGPELVPLQEAAADPGLGIMGIRGIFLLPGCPAPVSMETPLGE